MGMCVHFHILRTSYSYSASLITPYSVYICRFWVIFLGERRLALKVLTEEVVCASLVSSRAITTSYSYSTYSIPYIHSMFVGFGDSLAGTAPLHESVN